jgi:hypothetical protein
MSEFTKDLKYVVGKAGELASQAADWAVEYFSITAIPELEIILACIAYLVFMGWVFSRMDKLALRYIKSPQEPKPPEA